MRILILTLIVGLTYGAPAIPEVGLCEVCHLLVGEVQDLLTTTSTQDSISSYVNDACAKLPSEEKDVCNSFLKEHSGNLFDRLIKDLTPLEVCKSLTDVCPSYNEKLEPEVQLEQKEEMENPAGNPLECELCKLAVLGIDKLIKENRSSAAINSTLEKFCEGLPDKIKDVCIKIEPLILKGLTNGFEPGIVCKVATLCSVENSKAESQIPCDVCYTAIHALGVKDSESICASQTSCVKESEIERKHVSESIPEVKDTLECQICKFAVQAVDVIIEQNRSVIAINSTLENLCNSLPGELKDSCVNVEPDILKAILGGIDPTKACDFLKICNDNGNVPLSSQFIPCNVCKETLESMVGEKGVKICYQFKDVCGIEEIETKEQDLVPAVKVDYTMGEEESENLKEDAKCEICKYIIQLLDEAVGTNASIVQVNNTLYQICSFLPNNIKSLCPLFIPNIENALADGLDPTNTCIASNFCQKTEADLISIEDLKCAVCAEFVETLSEDEALRIKNGICYKACPNRHRRSADQESSLLYKVNQVMTSAKGLGGAAECELCKVAIRALDNIAGENASIETVNKTVYEICTRLTGIQLQQMCLQAAPKLAITLKNGLDPEKTCEGIQMCTEQETQVKVQKRSVSEDEESALMSIVKEKERHNVDSVACDLCEGVIEILDKLLADNATDEQINQTLYNLCSGLPGGAFQDLCLQIVPQIMTAVDNGFNPQTICVDVGLCTQKSKVRSKMPLKRKIVHEQRNDMESLVMAIAKEKEGQTVDSVACDLCEGVIEILDKLLADNATDEQINQTLYNLCSGLPSGAFQDLCLQIVPQIMTAVDNGFNPQTICVDVGLCTGNSKHEKRMRSNKKVVHKKNINDKDESILLNTIVAKRMEQQNVGDIACDLCEGLIEILDSVLAENETDAKINTTLYNLCSGLPDGALKDLCKQLAPSLLAVLENGFDPERACTLAGLCNDNTQKTKIQNNKEQIQEVEVEERGNLKDLKCEVCKAVIEELDSVVKQNGSIDMINETLYNVCDQLPGALHDLCLQAAPQILDALMNGVDPSEACGSIGLCSGDTEERNTNMAEKEESETNVEDVKCDICTLLVQGLDEVLKGNASAVQINETIFNLCSDLPGSAKSYCVMVAPAIVKALGDGVDPKAACTMLKLCAGEAEVIKMVENVGDIKCDICELVIRELDTIVGQNATAAKINATIYNLCSQLPGTAASYCVKVAPLVVNAIEGGVDPQAACSLLKLCDSSAEVIEMVENVGDIKCDICELVIRELDTIVGQNATAAKINATIYNLCSQLPGTAASYCVKVAPLVVNAIEGGVDPQAACSLLKLCDSSVEKDITFESVGDIKCDICELLIKELDTIVGQNASDAKINATIYNLCSQLPGTAAKYCVKVAPTIVNAIEGGVDPQAACSVIKLCDNSVEEDITFENIGDIKCDICELLIKELDTIVGQNASDAKINATIYNLCSQLPGTAAKYCVKVAPTIVNAIEGGVDPQAACSVIKLCDSSVEEDITFENIGDIKCDICELVIKELDSIVGQNASDAKLNATIYNLCSQLPGTAAKYCVKVAPTIINTIEGGVDPEAACSTIKLCDSSVEDTSFENVGDIKCDICELLIKEFDTVVGQNASAEKINATIFNLCSQLPGTAAKYCIKVAPTIVETIEGGVEPQAACSALNLCDASEPQYKVGDIKCEICELAVRKLDELMARNASKEKINATMYQLCNDLTGTNKIYCLLLAPAIVKEVEAGVQPPETCKDLKLCLSDSHIKANLKVRKEPLDCGVCAKSLTAVYEDLSGNYIKIERNLLQICNSMPEMFQKSCEGLVQHDNGRMFKKLIEQFSPTSLCELANCRNSEDLSNYS